MKRYVEVVGWRGRTRRVQRFPCLAGPHDGKRLTEDEAGEAYVRFNPSYRGRFHGKRYACVLVYRGALVGEEVRR